MFVVLQGRAWGGGVKDDLPTGPSTSPSSKKKGAYTHRQGKHPGQASKCFSGTFKFPPPILDNRKGGKLKVRQTAERSSGKGATRAWRSRTSYSRPLDRAGARPGQPGPSRAPLTLRRVHHRALGALPFLPRGPLFPTTRFPLTALTLRARVAAAAASSPTSNLLPSLPSQAKAPCHPAARETGGRWRRGGGGRRLGARAGRSQGRGCTGCSLVAKAGKGRDNGKPRPNIPAQPGGGALRGAPEGRRAYVHPPRLLGTRRPSVRLVASFPGVI
ncbi:hypothetical protein Cadr_000007202 [Camelus dromedarius]|uniref:Uncharacterized protein n=1 Tax=Camelus dromedarius TaxID=9838 RepID=A0A5N4E5X3_CAMDR|nr:hypothetical protein Cadr_000007202 [Camelus dromedarius]